MNKILLILLSVFLFSNCNSKVINLFNGSNLEGWYAYTDKDKKVAAPLSIFAVSDSMIRLYGEKQGYLMTLKTYENFELTAEYRWNTEEKYRRNNNVKNSGVMYNIPVDAPDSLWCRGIQFQIKEGFTGDFVLLDNVTLNVKNTVKGAGKSVVVTRFKDNDKPTGEWNTIVIQSKNGHCTQFLNGQLVNEGVDASTKEGRILLQYEGAPIDFRRIKLKVIK